MLPPVTKLGQGNVFTGVCDSVNRAGVCSRGGCLVLGGVPGPGGAWSRGVPGPAGCLVPGEGAWSRRVGVPTPGGCVPGLGVPDPGSVPGGDPPGMATAAGSTHPTGMDSCLIKLLSISLSLHQASIYST